MSENTGNRPSVAVVMYPLQYRAPNWRTRYLGVVRSGSIIERTSFENPDDIVRFTIQFKRPKQD